LFSRSRVVVALGLSVGACIERTPPQCFSDDECGLGLRCAAGLCAGSAAIEPGLDAEVPEPDASRRTDARVTAPDVDTPPDARAPGPEVSVPASTPDAGGPDAAAPRERCNAADDDGDGETDEGYAVGAPCVAGQGECLRAGVGVCTPEGEAQCGATLGTPGPEVCNLRDDDCDGLTDEGLDGLPCEALEGVCAQGSSDCTDAGEAVCVPLLAPGDETCNGLDDDCDTRTDEDFTVGEACDVDLPTCSVPGLWTCAPAVEGQGEPTVVCVPLALPTEVCNGLDDDCDSESDEETARACYSGPAGTLDVGRCAPGVQRCVDAAYLEGCPDEVVPTAELANGADDDCDGLTDENP
jgi:hypothetical protein